MTEVNETPVVTHGEIADATFIATPPEAVVTIIPDAPALSAAEQAAARAALPQDSGSTVLHDTETGDVIGLDANGSPVVDGFNSLTAELPIAAAPESVQIYESNSVLDLSDEDLTELQRLTRRTVQEPTSERAKQELLSFKSLKGIA